jgi:hypothetical protein
MNMKRVTFWPRYLCGGVQSQQRIESEITRLQDVLSRRYRSATAASGSEVPRRESGDRRADLMASADQIRSRRGVPRLLFNNSGSEFRSEFMELGTHCYGVHNR